MMSYNNSEKMYDLIMEIIIINKKYGKIYFNLETYQAIEVSLTLNDSCFTNGQEMKLSMPSPVNKTK